MNPNRRAVIAPDARFARWYGEWTLCGLLACAVAGFPDTPMGPLLLWAVVLPLIAGLLVHWRRRAGRRQLARGGNAALVCPPLQTPLRH